MEKNIRAATAATRRPCQESKTWGSPGPVSAAPSGSAERVPTVFRRTVRKPGFREIGGVIQLYAHCQEAQHVVFYSRAATAAALRPCRESKNGLDGTARGVPDAGRSGLPGPFGSVECDAPVYEPGPDRDRLLSLMARVFP